MTYEEHVVNEASKRVRALWYGQDLPQIQPYNGGTTIINYPRVRADVLSKTQEILWTNKKHLTKLDK